LLTVWLGNNSKELLALDVGVPTDDTIEGTPSGRVEEDMRGAGGGLTSEGRTAVKDQVMVGGGSNEGEELVAILVTTLVMVIWAVD
jgi:hypothetical protein